MGDGAEYKAIFDTENQQEVRLSLLQKTRALSLDVNKWQETVKLAKQDTWSATVVKF